jgi:hypothetical protein
MRFLTLSFLLVLISSIVVFAQSPGCGPNPIQMIPNQQFNQPSQAAQQAKQIQQIQATADFQAAMARIDTQIKISQIQNQSNPQMQQQTMKSFQDQKQLLQTNFNQTMQQLNQQR